jgi:16S rRNA (cytidine1402-2'-O)-methyltransferase
VSGKIIFGGFSIGNFKDIPVRVLELIDTVDVVAVEYLDPFKYYFNILNKNPKKIIEYRTNSESILQISKLISEAKNNKTILYLVDGGMPSIGDPGYQLLETAIKENIEVESIPGPSAITCAISLSGFSADSIIFSHNVSYLKNNRIQMFLLYKQIPSLLVFILPPSDKEVLKSSNIHQKSLSHSLLIEIFQDMVFIFGKDRQGVLCFNMTMEDEFIFRGNLEECLHWIKNNKIYSFLTIAIDKERDSLMI